MEGGFVYMSLTGTVATSNHWMSPLCMIPFVTILYTYNILGKEYGKADARWLYSDSCIVSMEMYISFS